MAVPPSTSSGLAYVPVRLVPYSAAIFLVKYPTESNATTAMSWTRKTKTNLMAKPPVMGLTDVE
jgi:hypothetical protein